jgi:hypothetical protein
MLKPFPFCVAVAPLALYLLVLGLINFSRRPVVVSGARDMAALGVAILGLLIVGPAELLFPRLPGELTGYFWLLLLFIYGLLLTLGVLLSAPRIVVYNVTLDQLRSVLSETVNELDPEVRWAGGSLSLPRLHVELYLDDGPSVRNVSLIATSSTQSYAGWRTLEKALRERLRATVENPPNAWGLGVLIAALCLAARMGWIVYHDSREITQGFVEMMRF